MTGREDRPGRAHEGHSHGHDHSTHGGHAHKHAAGHGHGDHGDHSGHGSHGGHAHGHQHGGLDASIVGSREAMRTLGRSLLILGVTAVLQVIVVIASGSVALLADTVHNFGDALTAVPLAAAFLLGRRPPTKRLTYGFGRVEDYAGLAVVGLILFSALFAAYEAIDRLIHPRDLEALGAVAIAGLLGFVGNEWVAVYRIRSGKRIGSAALVADGYHARVDGFTSLAVVLGALGAALGFQQADPIMGLVIALAIARIVWQSIAAIGLRALDGVEPGVVDRVSETATAVPGVKHVDDVRARWIGHCMRVELAVAVDPGQSVSDAAGVAAEVERRLIANVDFVNEAAVRALPRTPLPSAVG